ncbi:MAG: hypothetical protein IPL61_07230 [Myxococcales bacterium]|nr:hypothetical protein [Myxococcales bacterium]
MIRSGSIARWPLALVVAAAACARAPGPVDLTGAWPTQAGDYDAVNRAWTRRATLRADFSQMLEVIATFHAPPWHAARAARAARQRGGPTDEITAAARADAEGELEFALVVTTHDRDENDLDRGERSVWRLALVDERGVETPPSSIVRDKRPPTVLRAELPEFGDFAVAYRVRFPRTAAALGADVRATTLRMWSSRGAVSLQWRAAGR